MTRRRLRGDEREEGSGSGDEGGEELVFEEEVLAGTAEEGTRARMHLRHRLRREPERHHEQERAEHEVGGHENVLPPRHPAQGPRGPRRGSGAGWRRTEPRGRGPPRGGQSSVCGAAPAPRLPGTPPPPPAPPPSPPAGARAAMPKWDSAGPRRPRAARAAAARAARWRCRLSPAATPRRPPS
eukprot:3763533-Rhodomonas_salina.1